ncbi:MAG: hypothetical protein INH43_10090 [Acidobacteriaceae bacterium]|jgi:hypothetical protein|nr:hypothetical protein [Acidobacteriaceae bacterium]
MSPRTVLAVLLVAGVAFFSIGRFFQEISDFYARRPEVDGVTQFTARYAPVRAMLPEKGMIGYMADPGAGADELTATAELYLVQYALAPVIVVNSTDQRYFVTNFHTTVTTGSMADQGFRLVREFGNGVAVFENEKWGKR